MCQLFRAKNCGNIICCLKTLVVKVFFCELLKKVVLCMDFLPAEIVVFVGSWLDLYSLVTLQRVCLRFAKLPFCLNQVDFELAEKLVQYQSCDKENRLQTFDPTSNSN